LRTTFLTLLILLVSGAALFSQSFKVEGIITGQPDEEVIIGTLKGDTFTPADTAIPASGFILFDVPESAPTGMYRIILGQTTVAKVMHEPPQKIDFIFNKEDFVFKTNFNAPLDSIEVDSSQENKVWFDLIRDDSILASSVHRTVSPLISNLKTRAPVLI